MAKESKNHACPLSKFMRVGALAKLTQKTVRALHLYEERGLLEPAARTPGGFRLYDEKNVSRIGYIDRLQKIGCTLDEIRDLVQTWTAETNPRVAMAGVEAVYRERLAQVQATLKDLQTLETSLQHSLAFLTGCHDCDRAEAPAQVCCGCTRSTESKADLSLLRGLAKR